MRDLSRRVGFGFGFSFILAGLAASPLARAQDAAGQGEMNFLSSRVEDLRRQVDGLQASLRERDQSLDALKRDLGGVGEDVAALKERIQSLVALPFLSGPPPSSDAVGVSKVAVFAPRIAVDSSRQHDIVFLRLKRIEAAAVRSVADLEMSGDQLQIDLPLDQNGALYVVEWQTSEGQSYNLLLRDGAGGPDSLPPPLATVQVKPLQNQGRFLFVGYRLD
jgi:hypothetical protein